MWKCIGINDIITVEMLEWRNKLGRERNRISEIEKILIGELENV